MEAPTTEAIKQYSPYTIEELYEELEIKRKYGEDAKELIDYFYWRRQHG